MDGERREGGRETERGRGAVMLVRDQTQYKQGAAERGGPDPDRDPVSLSVTCSPM